jgi:radical SAM superfamily enzyme YgiQ (UPF0313 family)
MLPAHPSFFGEHPMPPTEPSSPALAHGSLRAGETADRRRASILTVADPSLPMAEREIERLFPGRAIRQVLVVQPPDGSADALDFDFARDGRYLNYPPYGLGLIATMLRRHGIDVRIVNLNNAVLRAAAEASERAIFDYQSVVEQHLREAIGEFTPDFVGVTAMYSMVHQSALDCCAKIRELVPEVPLALGGVHITNSFSSTTTQAKLLVDFAAADLIFTFEAEISFCNFVRVVNRELPVTALAQVAFLGLDPVLYIENRAVPHGETLDARPAFDLMQLEELSTYGRIGSMAFLLPPGTRIGTSLSNRGCRAECTFCSVRQFNGVGVRGRSVQAVIDELLVLRNEHGIQHVVWLDDDFLFDHRRALRLFNEMVKQQVGLTWDCTNGVIAASCSDELVGGAAAAGCIGLYIGMESGNREILRAIKKPGNPRHFLKAAETLRKYEQINSRVYLIFGFPGETFAMIGETIALAREMNLDWYDFGPLHPLPNTPMADAFAEERDFNTLRFGSNPFSQRAQEAARAGDLLMIDFESAFRSADPNAILLPDQYETIWAYMFYHLNYERLFGEDRHIKLRQAYAHIDHLVKTIIRRSAFGWYFRNYLAHRIWGEVDAASHRRLASLLDEHPVYRERFVQLNMPRDWLDRAAAN